MDWLLYDNGLRHERANNANFTQASSQKHLGIIMDNQLKFDDHLKMGLLCKWQNHLPRTALTTIYKAFIRPRLDYDDIFMIKRIICLH